VKASRALEVTTKVRKPQKRKVLAFSLATPLSLSSGEPPELDQTRLVRMQFQTEPYQPFPKLRKEPLGVGSVLKAHHKIVGIADDDDIAACDFLAPSFNPQVEHIVQIHVGEQR